MKYRAILIVAALSSLALCSAKNSSAIVAANSFAAAPAVPTAPPATRAVLERCGGLWEAAKPVFSNPAVRQWQFDSSLTTIGAGYNSRSDHGTIDPRRGSSLYDIYGGADTYTKYKSSTLWGGARYTNGRTGDVVWCETSDADMLYPYLSADSVGGDLKREVYSFAGGYADHRGRWAWGCELAYEAKLEYRGRDPRPRNVCGTLDAAVGVGYRLLPLYWLNLGLQLRKYKQSNDIEFKSEMGSDKIFHLTGPVESYQRFDGAADAARYDGYRYGLNLSLYPSSRQGMFANVSLSRFTYDCILTDLNRLPMASLWHNTLEVRAGWLQSGRRWQLSAYAQLDASRRHGTENLFGDPASNAYPQIGSVEMFGRNHTAVSAAVSAAWLRSDTDILRLYVSGGWARTVTAYLEPWHYSRLKHNTIGAELQYDKVISHGLLLSAQTGLNALVPYNCDYTAGAVDAELAGLERIDRHVYDLESNRRLKINAGLSLLIPLGSRYGLQISAWWLRHDYHTAAHSDSFNTAVSIVF